MSSSICNGDFNVFPMSCAYPHLQYGSMVYCSLSVQCSINISWVYRELYVIGWESVFPDKACVTVDTFCSTVQDSLGIDFFPVVCNLNVYLHRRMSYILNCIWWYIGNLDDQRLPILLVVQQGIDTTLLGDAPREFQEKTDFCLY